MSSYKKGSFSVGPIYHLPHLPDVMKNAVKVFEDYFRASGKKAFDAEDHSGTWRQLTIRSSLTGNVMAIVVIHPQNMTTEEIEGIKNDLKTVTESCKNVTSLFFQAMGRKQSGEDPPVEHLSGLTHLPERLCGLDFAISPLAFFQVFLLTIL